MVPYELTLGGEPYSVVDSLTTRAEYLKDHPEVSPSDIGLIAVAVFRLDAYADYAAVGKVDDLKEEIIWSRCYEAYEWIDWMAGSVWRDPERTKELKDTERKLGQFLVQYGWAPPVCLETSPGDDEMKGYIDHVISKDVKDGQLFIPGEDSGS